MALALFLLGCFVANANASAMNSDIVYVSTINGQPNGIAISSSVWVSAGSSITLQGATGFLANNSSMTASAFFGDGSNLANVVTYSATQTFSGGNTFTSSFTIQSHGRQIILSTSTSASNLTLKPDGTVSFTPSLHSSSATIVPNASTTNQTFGPCVPGSTITITTSGGRVEVVFTGKISNDETGNNNLPLVHYAILNFLQDGTYVRDLSPTKGIVFTNGTNSLYGDDAGSFRYLLDAPAPGPHSYCLTLATQGRTSSQSGGANLGGEAYASSFFYVMELK